MHKEQDVQRWWTGERIRRTQKKTHTHTQTHFHGHIHMWMAESLRTNPVEWGWRYSKDWKSIGFGMWCERVLLLFSMGATEGCKAKSHEIRFVFLHRILVPWGWRISKLRSKSGNQLGVACSGSGEKWWQSLILSWTASPGVHSVHPHSTKELRMRREYAKHKELTEAWELTKCILSCGQEFPNSVWIYRRVPPLHEHFHTLGV